MEQTYCYIGTKPCGCVVAACADLPNTKKETARFLSDCVKDGWTVTRIPLDEVRGKLKVCKCEEEQKKQNAPSLFAE